MLAENVVCAENDSGKPCAGSSELEVTFSAAPRHPHNQQ